MGIDSWVEDSDAHGFSSMRIVTATDFSAYHGGMIATNPPAGPPAETTSRSSGVRSAVCTRSGSFPTTAALPTDADDVGAGPDRIREHVAADRANVRVEELARITRPLVQHLVGRQRC